MEESKDMPSRNETLSHPSGEPKKEKKGLSSNIRRRVAATGLATVLGIVGLGATSASNKDTNTRTDSAPVMEPAKHINSPTKSESDVNNSSESLPETPSLSEVDPSWLDLIPKNKEAKENVPLNPKTIEHYEYAMSHIPSEDQEFPANFDSNKVTINKFGTIIDVVPDEKTNGVWVEVNVPGDKLTPVTDENGNTQYYGLSVKYLIQNDITVENGNDSKDIKTGLESIAPYLKQGDYITFAYQNKNLADPFNEINYETFWKLDDSDSYSYSREKGNDFVIKATTAIVYPNQE